MRSRRTTRSVVAIIAAYALALQALLSGTVLASHAAAAASAAEVICASDAGHGSTDHPLGHVEDCQCGPACTMSAGDTPVGVVVDAGALIVWSATRASTLETPVRAQLASIDAAAGSHRPRAPPLA
jgi:hypothetical protein